MKEKPKLFVVRKYIKARTAAEAIRKDRTTDVSEVWVDDEWKKGAATELASAIGFNIERSEPEDDEE